MPSIDPYLDYDIEDTPRYWREHDQEINIRNEILERRLKNDDK